MLSRIKDTQIISSIIDIIENMIFIQEEIKSAAVKPLKPSLLWSTRGKLDQIANKKDADKLLIENWRKPTSDEILRFKAGDYNPIYDQGEQASNQYTVGARISVPKTGNLLKIIVL